MSESETSSGKISILLVGIFLIGILGQVSTATSVDQNMSQPDTYITQFGPGFAETEIASVSDNLDVPRDLEFHPSPSRQNELWVVNRATDSVTIVHNAGQSNQLSEHRLDSNRNHFMEEVSAIAFGDWHEEFDYQFATAQESRNTYNGQGNPNNFMGPALWPSSLSHFAEENQEPGGLLGSHIDMLHESPFGMGIAHDSENVYWYNDGYYEELVRYDFQEDHDTGEDDHSDGKVRRYADISLTRAPGVPGHMEMNHDNGILYIADTGAGRVIWVNTSDPGVTTNIMGDETQMEPLAEYSEVTGVEWGILANGLSSPSGVALHQGILFVSQNGNGDITGYNLDEDGKGIKKSRTVNTNAGSIMGLEVGPEGKLWYVDSQNDLVIRIDPYEDTDFDEVRDSIDVYPNNSLLWSDNDGDGFADQSGTDISDDCPEIAGPSTLGSVGCIDSDGDRWADTNDEYPMDETQWVDSDGDGYGDNQTGTDPDSCPSVPGYSEFDRMGCPDADEDGYSDPSGDWDIGDGADAFPTKDTQWRDSDSDGFGDNPSPAYLSDDCPSVSGSSTQDLLGCLDSDSDGWSDDGDIFKDDPSQWSDSDSDGYGDNPSPASMPDYCPNEWGNSTISLLGCPDSDGDGWSDIEDSHPDINQLWSDSDGDGYANQEGTDLSDDCPEIFGTSIQDRIGCVDSDGDGWSDEGDYYPSDSSRHSKSLLPTIVIIAILVLIASVAAYVVMRRH
ncbi:MAG: hypothetical protein L7R66_02870 [Candidatus Thalassarchaeaceae archaeon]|nr:hypothetical protein [Candidatus Thalassarchaeaceae archaeon]